VGLEVVEEEGGVVGGERGWLVLWDKGCGHGLLAFGCWGSIAGCRGAEGCDCGRFPPTPRERGTPNLMRLRSQRRRGRRYHLGDLG
jgi:hypothetical protein